MSEGRRREEGEVGVEEGEEGEEEGEEGRMLLLLGRWARVEGTVWEGGRKGGREE